MTSQATTLNLQDRRMSALELQDLTGCLQINRVVVTYANGMQTTIDPARQLDEHAPNLRIDLGAQGPYTGVASLTIFGGGEGSFRVLGA
jgi:hypothetical protein